MISIDKIAQVTGHKGSIFALLHQNDDFFLSAGGEGWVVSWQLSNPDPGRLLARVSSNVFALYQNDQTVIAGDMNGGLHWIDLKTNETIDIQHHRKGIFDIWEYNGMIHALGGDGYLSRRPLDDPRAVESVQLSHQALRCQTAIDGDSIAVGSSDGSIYFVDLNTLDVQHQIENAHENSVFSLACEHNPKAALNILNWLVSSKGPEADTRARLFKAMLTMDKDGTPIHEWAKSFKNIDKKI